MNIAYVNQTIGKTFADNLNSIVLSFGSVSYTRDQLVRLLGCGNFVAAHALGHTLKKIRVTTVKQLASLDPIALYKVHGCGHTQVYVAMCLLEAAGEDVAKWWGWDMKGSAVQHRARTTKKRRGADEVPLSRPVTYDNVEAHA